MMLSKNMTSQPVLGNGTRGPRISKYEGAFSAGRGAYTGKEDGTCTSIVRLVMMHNSRSGKLINKIWHLE